MKYIFCLVLSLSLVACSSKSGKEEKELATQALINCDFDGAIEYAEIAIKHAGDNVEIAVPALLIIGKSSEILGRDTDSNTAYRKIVALVSENVPNVSEAKKIANKFVKSLERVAPEKVKVCTALQS